MRLRNLLGYLNPAVWLGFVPPPHARDRTNAAEPPLPPQPLVPDDGRRTQVDATKIGRGAVGSKSIKAFGKDIPRIAAPIDDVGALQDGLANVLHDLFSNRGVLHDRDFDASRNEAAVGAAMAMPLVEGAPVGRLTVFRPGLGNTAAGPAQIAYLARHTERLIIAHANPGRGDTARLRPATHVDGVPIPAELQGKIFEIGAPDAIMISWEQSSDLMVEQLDRITRSPLMKDLDPRTVGLSLIGHSQGGVDIARTRERLEAADIHVVDKVGTLGSPFGGSTVSDESMLGLVTEIGERALGLQAAARSTASIPTCWPKRSVGTTNGWSMRR